MPHAHRLLTFATLTVAGTLAALFASWALVLAGVGPDELFWAFLSGGGPVFAVALACGVVVGLAGASARSLVGTFRRAAAASLVLLALGAGAMAASGAIPEPAFDAAAFRSAVAADELERIEEQAYRAVEQDALIGLSAAEARRTLGAPQRTRRDGRLWVWYVGTINDAIGPGDDGWLYVRLDPAGRRVVSARVS